MDSKCLKAYLCMGFCEFYLQNYDKAASNFDTASKMQPDNKFLQQNLAKVKEALHKYRTKEDTK